MDLSLLHQAAQQQKQNQQQAVPRGSVLLQQVGSSSAAVQTGDNENVLWDWITTSTTTTTTATPKRQLQKHSSSGEESREIIHWNFINYDMVFSARWIKNVVNRCRHLHQQLSSNSYKHEKRSLRMT